MPSASSPVNPGYTTLRPTSLSYGDAPNKCWPATTTPSNLNLTLLNVGPTQRRWERITECSKVPQGVHVPSVSAERV